MDAAPKHRDQPRRRSLPASKRQQTGQGTDITNGGRTHGRRTEAQRHIMEAQPASEQTPTDGPRLGHYERDTERRTEAQKTSLEAQPADKQTPTDGPRLRKCERGTLT